MEGGSSGDNIQEGTSNLQGSAKTVEIKIKMLDSQVYTCHVEETISVPALKEHIAILTGVPVENQRLICRGKVLKDDHILSAYNVEDGHTLHLVTRQVPQPGAASSGGTSRSAGDGEQQGLADSPPAVSRNRSGQVSHSVVLGTFNMPDPGDGVVPDVGRIITSMLTSLGITNLVPTNSGANNGGSIGGTVIPTAMQPPAVNLQDRPAGAGGGRPHVAADGHHSLPAEQGASQNIDPQNDAMRSLWPTGGLIGATPTLGQQIRLMQQAMVVPDALTTMSQYLNRLEQAFTTFAQQHVQFSAAAATPFLSPGIQTSSSFVSQPIGAQAPFRSHPTPANLGALIRRTMGLFSSPEGTELTRLASQLENEPNLADAVARGELQSLTLRSGILMQHMGALLLELGRSTLTTRMGSSPVESAVNSGPALFISPAEPNPMMVQPLPFQPGAGFGTLVGGAQQNVGAMSPSLGSHEVPRNINIHIHASDSGLASGVPSQFPIPSQVPPRAQADASNDRVSTSTQASTITTSLGTGNDSASIPVQAPTTGALNHTASGSNAPIMQNIPVSLLGGGFPAANEQAGVRAMPMRTVVAAMPATLHNRPPTEITGNSLTAFYPLLARFQQLNSTNILQQGGGLQAASSNGILPGLSIVQPGTVPTQQPTNPALSPTQAQVQVQAWVPWTSQTVQGQGELRPISREGSLQIPVTSLPLETPLIDLRQQQSPNAGTVSRSALVPVTTPSNMVTAGGVTLPSDGQQPLELNETAPRVAGTSVTEKDACEEHVNESKIQTHKQAELSRVGDEIQAAGLPIGEKNPRATSGSGRADSKRKIKSKELPSAPAGLGLGGLQPLPPLPPRMHRRSNRQQHRQQAVDTFGQAVRGPSTSSRHQGNNLVALSNTGKNSFQEFVSSIAPRSEERGADGTGSAKISTGTSQLHNSVGNRGHLSRGSQSNVDIGNMISQIMANSSGGNSSATATARDTNQGLAVPARALGSVMGQLMQNPLFKNAVQQVANQVREEQGFQDMVSQGGLNLSGVLQQMMPVVSQALGRVAATSSEQGSGVPRENAGGRGGTGVIHGTEQINEATPRLEDVLPQGDLSGVLQQLIPIVSQALGRGTATSLEQVSGSSRENAGGRGRLGVDSGTEQQMMPVIAQAIGKAASEQSTSATYDPQIRPIGDVGPVEGAGLVNGQDRWKHPQNQDKLPQQSQTTTSIEQQQSTAQMQWPVSEINSGGAPVAKRQKIDLERAVRKLEQDKSPQEIFRVVAEFATVVMAPNDSPGLDAFTLAEHLSQDDGLVNDYIALLSRDFNTPTSEDPEVKDSNTLK